jgi:hypothetical protein
MWSTSAGGQLMKVVNLTGFTVYISLEHVESSDTKPTNFQHAVRTLKSLFLFVIIEGIKAVLLKIQVSVMLHCIVG